MTALVYHTKEDIERAAAVVIGKTLRELVSTEDAESIEKELIRYGRNRRGYFGDLVEKYVFGLENNGRAEADFKEAGVELKTTPLRRHSPKGYVSKERLVFSMIDYMNIVGEKWETSSFLAKNRLLFILFYLYLNPQQSLLDYEFKFQKLLDLLGDLEEQDVIQIRKDWESIVAKIKRGEAHLLSEGDTYYLGACTKARDSRVLRDQPMSDIRAKPRAFSLKQAYLNYLIQKHLLGREPEGDTIYKGEKASMTIEDVVRDKFGKYIGMTDRQILRELGWSPSVKPKNYKRLIANRILTGTGSNKIEEFEKANVTMRVVTLEPSGTLRESVSFPAFDYKELTEEAWYDEESGTMADFHAELEENRFFFVVFQKMTGSKDIVLKKVAFWNFPISDLPEAQRVFERAQQCVREGRYEDLPKGSESKVAHVRPHGQDSTDTQETPQGTMEMKRCFWLNARYIQEALERLPGI